MSLVVHIISGVSLNITLLLFLAFAWVGIIRQIPDTPGWWRDSLLGALMGLGMTLGIFASLEMNTYVDSRATVVSMAAAFGGPMPGIIAIGIGIIATVAAEGVAAPPGIMYSLTGLAIGLWCYERYHGRIHEQPLPIFGVIGSILAVNVLFWVLLLMPSDLLLAISAEFVVFVLIAYPASAILMGAQMARELRRLNLDRLLVREFDILQTALENVATPVAITRFHDGRFLYANRAMLELLRIPAHNTHRNRSTDFYRDVDERYKLMDRLKNASSFTDHELALYRADGTPVDVLVNMQTILFDGEPALATSMIDITERKRREQAAFDVAMQQERMRMMADFMQNISHDVKTPLSTLQTSLYLMDRTEDPERRERHRRVMGDQVERLSRILDQFFEMARLDSETATMKQEIALDSLLMGVRDNIARRAEDKSVSLRVHFPDDRQGIIVGENRQLNQMLMHLIENALHYTPQGGSITVAASIMPHHGGEQAMITVCDTGPGISAEHLPHIFEHFYRVDAARRVETGGTGLGLAIAQKIAEDHEGNISAHSIVGEGSTFTVRLPYKKQAITNSCMMMDYVPRRHREEQPV